MKKAVSLMDFTIGMTIFFMFLSLFFTYVKLKNDSLERARTYRKLLSELTEVMEREKAKPLPKNLPVEREFTPKTFPKGKGKIRLRKITKGLVEIYVEIQWTSQGGGKEWLVALHPQPSP